MSTRDESAGAELVEGLRRGDARAFDVAYARHRDAVWRFLVHLCGRRDLAEDLFQETWLRLARHARGLAPGTSLVAWLYTVARNLHQSEVRWAALDSRARAAIARWWYLAEPAATDLRADASVALDRIRSAFDVLPPVHREVLLLAVGEGLSSVEVAQVLGLSHDAARQRLSRARAALADALGTAASQPSARSGLTGAPAPAVADVGDPTRATGRGRGGHRNAH